MDPITEIKTRLPIEDLAGEYCQLNKKGRSFMALCPFHNDSHPSLLISPDKGIAYCFACQTGGDVFSFYQAIEGVDFPQALKDLAEKVDVQLPKQHIPTGPKRDEKERMRECLECALSFYQNSLHENDAAQRYLRDERKIIPELIELFEIGCAPDSFDATYSHLLKRGFSRSEILGAGLGIQRELEQERIYDRFRNRIIFPIRDHRSALIGFGGRTLGEDDAKYINSPDGPLYNKSVALFGISLAKDAIRKSKSVILVEGYFDVLALRSIGIEHVVAVSGTALTEQHANLIKRTAERVILALDSDSAGIKAAERAFMLCKAQDLDVRMIALPSGNDPDECAHLVPEELKKICEEGGLPYLDCVLSSLQSNDQREALHTLIPLLNSIPSAVEREDAIRKVAHALSTTETALKDDLEREKAHAQQAQQEQRVVSAPFSSMELLLGLLLAYPEHLSFIDRVLQPEGERANALYTVLKEWKNSDKPPNLDTLELALSEHASVLQLYCEEHFGAWSAAMAQREIKKLLTKVNREHLLKQQKKLIDEIRTARSEGRKGEEEKLLTQYQQVLKLAAMAK